MESVRFHTCLQMMWNHVHLSRVQAETLGDNVWDLVSARRESWYRKLSPLEAALITRINAIAGEPENYECSSTVVSAAAREAAKNQMACQIASDLKPWKKGPFRIAGTTIDAEWRSDLKWERIAPHIDLRNKVIADIGCHNGYFMFRMDHGAPRLVLGIEPIFRAAAGFALIQQLAQRSALRWEPLGVQDMGSFTESFDVIFCLGVLYHHTDPVSLLRQMLGATRRGGEIWIDCQGLAPSFGENVLVPKGRYCGASGIWWVPTALAVQNWMQRSGWRDVEVIYSAPLSVEEQRATEWATILSLKDFLDPSDGAKTMEGYPAPWRHYLRARKA